MVCLFSQVPVFISNILIFFLFGIHKQQSQKASSYDVQFRLYVLGFHVRSKKNRAKKVEYIIIIIIIIIIITKASF